MKGNHRVEAGLRSFLLSVGHPNLLLPRNRPDLLRLSASPESLVDDGPQPGRVSCDGGLKSSNSYTRPRNSYLFSPKRW